MSNKEMILKSIIERAIKRLICKSLMISEKEFDPSVIEYYPVWKKHRHDGQKTLARLKIRKRKGYNFSNINIEAIEDQGILGDDMIEYFIEYNSRKINAKDFVSENHLIFS